MNLMGRGGNKRWGPGNRKRQEEMEQGSRREVDRRKRRTGREEGGNGGEERGQEMEEKRQGSGGESRNTVISKSRRLCSLYDRLLPQRHLTENKVSMNDIVPTKATAVETSIKYIKIVL